GMFSGEAVLDLDYEEDADCDTDMNVVMTGAGRFVEVQGTAEGVAFSRSEMDTLITLAEGGIRALIAEQKRSLDERGGPWGFAAGPGPVSRASFSPRAMPESCASFAACSRHWASK